MFLARTVFLYLNEKGHYPVAYGSVDDVNRFFPTKILMSTSFSSIEAFTMARFFSSRLS